MHRIFNYLFTCFYNLLIILSNIVNTIYMKYNHMSISILEDVHGISKIKYYHNNKNYQMVFKSSDFNCRTESLAVILLDEYNGNWKDVTNLFNQLKGPVPWLCSIKISEFLLLNKIYYNENMIISVVSNSGANYNLELDDNIALLNPLPISYNNLFIGS